MKISKSEAGKLGAAKSKIVIELAKQKRIANYNANPVFCLNCKSVILYEKRSNKFCSHSCAGLYTNARKDWSNIKTGPQSKRENSKSVTHNFVIVGNKAIWNCMNCNKEHTAPKHKIGKYCNAKCQQAHAYAERIKNWDTDAPNPGIIKRYLKETFGNRCSVCGIDSWNNKELVLELEHRDGNSQNNTKENVCLICPNCHSQTDTYKGKNKGNGRFLRRKRYSEGKSF